MEEEAAAVWIHSWDFLVVEAGAGAEGASWCHHFMTVVVPTPLAALVIALFTTRDGPRFDSIDRNLVPAHTASTRYQVHTTKGCGRKGSHESRQRGL